MKVGGHKFPVQLAEVIMTAIQGLQEDEYAHGRTAAFWHIMGALDHHMKRDHNASGIEARQGGDACGSVHESPVAKPDAQILREGPQP